MRGALFVVFATICLLLAPPEAGAERSLFPEGRTFPLLVADPLEPRFGFDWVEAGRVSAHAGRSVALARLGRTDVRIDGMLWAWLRQTPGFNFPLETVDGSFGIALETVHGPVATRLRYGHVSSHLGDGEIDVAENTIVYSRESISLAFAWTRSRRFTAYAGPTFMLRGEPDAPAFQLQAGGEVRFRSAPGPGIVPYAAADLRMKQENANRINQSYELGVRIMSRATPAMRIAAGFARGVSERGQLWRRAESFFRLGITLGD
jgi:hypothetical protein